MQSISLRHYLPDLRPILKTESTDWNNMPVHLLEKEAQQLELRLGEQKLQSLLDHQLPAHPLLQ